MKSAEYSDLEEDGEPGQEEEAEEGEAQATAEAPTPQHGGSTTDALGAWVSAYQPRTFSQKKRNARRSAKSEGQLPGTLTAALPLPRRPRAHRLLLPATRAFRTAGPASLSRGGAQDPPLALEHRERRLVRICLPLGLLLGSPSALAPSPVLPLCARPMLTVLLLLLCSWPAIRRFTRPSSGSMWTCSTFTSISCSTDRSARKMTLNTSTLCRHRLLTNRRRSLIGTRRRYRSRDPPDSRLMNSSRSWHTLPRSSPRCLCPRPPFVGLTRIGADAQPALLGTNLGSTNPSLLPHTRLGIGLSRAVAALAHSRRAKRRVHR